MDVTLVRWPSEEGLRRGLSRDGRLRLLLVEEGVAPPPPEDCLEDWIRVPAEDVDVRWRVIGLEARCRRHGTTAGPRPSLADAVLRHGDAWVALPPIEARLAAVLVDRLGSVVSREALVRAGWQDGAPGRNALDVHVLRLRRRLAVLGLVLRTVRSRGYLLEVPGAAPDRSRAPADQSSDRRRDPCDSSPPSSSPMSSTR
jgi:DNA-binding winged helix-turn-helix (wHTH) protein